MTRRRKIIIAIIAVLLILLVVLLLIQKPQPAPQAPAENAAVSVNTKLSTGGLTNTSVSSNVAPASANAAPIVQPKADEEFNVIRLAAAFAERYGSFSNQTSYENLLELKPLMTASFAASTDSYVAAQRAASAPADEYFGITTRAMTTAVSAFDNDGGKARLTVKGQRREISGNYPDGRVYYQDIVLDFLKQGDEWRVNAAQWQQ